MFGYVTVNENELKMKEVRRYKSFYCGLCRSLKKRFGLRGQAVLPYDMAFVDILLNGLYEMPVEERDITCLAHPLEKQHVVYNAITDYTADMGVLLAYYKLRDDLEDGQKRVRAGVMAGALRNPVREASAEWPRQAAAVKEYVESLSQLEKSGTYDIDLSAGFSGKALGEILAMEEDCWAEGLRKTGFWLGKFVYLMDAWEDLEGDRKKGRYNPWNPYAGRVDLEAFAENTLMMMMAECAREFEKLPIVQDIEILRNIIYSGVWMKYAEMGRKKEEKEKKARALS